MKVSRTVTYAVQALLQLSQQQSQAPVPCGRIAKDGHMPERFLLQILRDLVNSGILRSVRGVEGGYLLDKSPDRVTLEDVFEAVASPLVASVPPLDQLSDAAREKLLTTFNGIASLARAELRKVTLSDLVLASGSIAPPAEPPKQASHPAGGDVVDKS